MIETPLVSVVLQHGMVFRKTLWFVSYKRAMQRGKFAVTCTARSNIVKACRCYSDEQQSYYGATV